ncbi:hypothetical protein M9Y10_038046 [Tritrichomonas musculus]|mgnify:CR=1 FL=1|uniref:Small GTP-binding protein n=1 Tax=Tritrichomonas musculus TaxID=1915356 RepID=A0ABR2K801_9EUKA
MTQNENQVSIKLIIVGSSGVGKTSLISALFKRKFEKNVNQTVAPAFCNANIQVDDGLVVDLQIWDTAGQEQYQSICQMFYRDAKVAFICYERANKEYIEQWYTRVKNNVSDCNFILITTKGDMLSQDEAEDEKVKSKEIADSLEIKYHLITSSKTGENVSESFRLAASFANFSTHKSIPSLKVEEKNRSSCC